MKKLDPEIKQSRKEFSKWLLIQETALIWITTITFLLLAFICICKEFVGELPWLAAMAAFPWTAYGVSQAFYYRKAMSENTKGGIKYDSLFNINEDNTVCENSSEEDVAQG
jgi:hypothetical protein